jgi:uncharacterized protein YukE
MVGEITWASPSSVGITDGRAAAAWVRLTQVWAQDMRNLASEFSDLGTRLLLAGVAYQGTDDSAMQYSVHDAVLDPLGAR